MALRGGKDYGGGPAMVSHTYSGPGTYIVTLTDQDGASTTFSRSVMVTEAPTTTTYRGIVATIPGTIEAENFDEGGVNLAYVSMSLGNSDGQTARTLVRADC